MCLQPSPPERLNPKYQQQAGSLEEALTVVDRQARRPSYEVRYLWPVGVRGVYSVSTVQGREPCRLDQGDGHWRNAYTWDKCGGFLKG